jgi:hypothetical protein
MQKLEKLIKIIFKSVFIVVIFAVFAYGLAAILIQPSNDRNWSTDQEILPKIKINRDTVTIEDIRNFTYASTTSYTPAYYSASYQRGTVKRVWFIVEPFKGLGAAHTFLSFEFDDGRYLPISVEIRKEKGETFNPILGLMRQYELMYVIGDEQDLVKLRTNYRHDDVYMYPMKTTKERANELFEDMLIRAQETQASPEFYNTLTNTCTTNIVDHVNKVYYKRVPFDWSVLFPADADYYAYKLGLIDTNLPIGKIRGAYRINDLAERYANDADFSKRIRGL